ncbi:MAG: 2OG-Fe(II) oxygenase [Hyphomonadaceae bacterium]|nr:2OG-Fe(II) oxygenase [Hyphomonadaceae bacterium]
MSADTLAELRARADAGDRAAMTAYGKHLLIGDDKERPRVPEGAAYIARAAALDEAEALAQHAVLVASGIAHKASWDQGLDLMQRSAELGWAPAQDQIRFLAQRDGDDFAALRAAINVRDWIKPRAFNVVMEQPRILTAAAFMSPAECARLISRSLAMRRADVYDPASGAAMIAKERSNKKSEVTLANMDLPFLMVHARMAATTGLPNQFFELTNILHYSPGEQFRPHFDYLDPSNPSLQADLQARGQRVVTFLVYLNDDYEGGETEFPRLDYRFKGNTGDALMFGNVDARGAPDPRTLHAGLPPTSGEKWLLSQWVRNKADRTAA